MPLWGASESRLLTIIGDLLMANRLLTGWSLVRIRPGEPRQIKGLGNAPPLQVHLWGTAGVQ